MEPHVKERIVGAAVLVALGVWLIPWVLDGPDEIIDEPEPAPAPGIRLQSPDEAAPRRTETVELQPSVRPAASSSVNETLNEPISDAEPAQVARVVPERAATIAPAQADDSGAEDSSADVLSTDNRPVESPPPAGDTVAASRGPIENRSAAGGWAVQLGAFGDVANADQLANRATSYGYPATVTEIPSGSRIMHRVRVVGFDTENQAQAAASSLSAHNITVQVIPPE